MDILVGACIYMKPAVEWSKLKLYILLQLYDSRRKRGIIGVTYFIIAFIQDYEKS